MGYSKKSAREIASQNLTKPAIAVAIEEQLGRIPFSERFFNAPIAPAGLRRAFLRPPGFLSDIYFRNPAPML
jgi:hypothetical protein